jgi:hypothetical protein
VSRNFGAVRAGAREAHSAPALRLPGLPEKVDPLTWRRAAETRLELLHDAMLAIIAALDAMDGDSDREPSICGSYGAGHVLITDDREGGDVLDEGEPNDWDGEANGDDEPSLGWSHAGQGGIPMGWGHHPMLGGGLDHDD